MSNSKFFTSSHNFCFNTGFTLKLFCTFSFLEWALMYLFEFLLPSGILHWELWSTLLTPHWYFLFLHMFGGTPKMHQKSTAKPFVAILISTSWALWHFVLAWGWSPAEKQTTQNALSSHFLIAQHSHPPPVLPCRRTCFKTQTPAHAQN